MRYYGSVSQCITVGVLRPQCWRFSGLALSAGWVCPAVVYNESAGVSSQCIALWPLRLQVAHTCRNLRVPGKAQRPLFHDEQMRSRVSGSGNTSPCCRRRRRSGDWDMAEGHDGGCMQTSFHGCLPTRAACCWQNHLLYSSQPAPPWHWASRMNR